MEELLQQPEEKVSFDTVCEHYYVFDGYKEGDMVSVMCDHKCGHGCMINPTEVSIVDGKFVSI